MLRLTRGDTADWKFYRKSCDGTVIGTIPAELTFTMRQTPTSAVAIQKTYTGGGITFDTAALELGVYGFDIQVEDEDYVKTIAVDKVKITVDYTYEEVSA